MRGRYCICRVALCILTLIISEQFAYCQSVGLAFASNEVVQDKRTGLDLSPKSTLCFTDNFEISFDILILPNRYEYFGYILRLIENDKRNIDLIFDNGPNHFKVVVSENLPRIVFNISNDSLFQKWNKIKLQFNVRSKTLTVTAANKSFSQQLDISEKSCYKMLFGANNFGDFQTTDVPPMKIRNVQISESLKLRNEWKLDEEDSNIARDNIGKSNGFVINPVWIKKQHFEWQLQKNFLLDGPASAAFDKESGRVFLIGLDSMIDFNTTNGQVNALKYKSGRLNLLKGNQSLYDSESQKLYNFYVDQNTVSTFNFRNNSWDKNFVTAPVTDNWHVNKFYSDIDSSLYILGGYGHFRYKNEVKQYHFASQKWDTIKPVGDVFTPRYLAALGAAKGGFYVIGGYGSVSGQQILSPKNLYDLLYFDIKEKRFKKIYELKIKTEDFVFGNSLVVDEKTKSYYGFIFPKHKFNSSLQLIKGSLENPAIQTVGSSIPYRFHDISSFADLFFCPLSENLVAISLFLNENNKTEVSVYTLSFPPLEPVKKTSEEAKPPFVLRWYHILLIVGIISGLGALFMLYFKRRDGIVTKAEPEANFNSVSHDTTTTIHTPDGDEPQRHSEREVTVLRNRIMLFGDLQLFDPDGADITKYFTPLIKELFLVILLNTIRNERGISSEKLKELLWYDKTADSARNNRSVNIAKLKSILDKMQYCEVSKETGYWKINIDYSHIDVDYQDYLDIVKDKGKLDKQKIQRLAIITQRGPFLSNVDYEWVESFKSEISNEVIDTYLHYADSIKITDDPEFLIKIANYIFHFDSVNEEAMIIKCKALVTLGKHSLAKNTFETFNKEYKILYGEEFRSNFQDILD